MRSPGDPQGFFANESQMDLVAKKLGMDPIKFRQKNFMHDGDIDPTGEEYSYIKTDETLKKALEDSGYQRPKPKNVGRGVALVQWTPAGGIGTVAISLDENGVATISSAMADQGAGTYTILSEIVAEELKIPLSQDQDSATGHADRHQGHRCRRQPRDASLRQRRLPSGTQGRRGH